MGYEGPMSEDKPEDTTTEDAPTSGGASDATNEGISDDQLPPDVQPSEDNPLARHPDQTGDEDDKIGVDTEGEPETAPMTADDAEYSQGSGSS